MKVTKLDNKKLNEEELRSNQNMHKPEDVHIHADIPYGVARDEDTAAQEHAEEVYDALEKDASSVTPKDPDTGNVKIPKNMYAEKIALDESLFTEDVDDVDKGEVVAFLKDSVEWLIDEQMGCSTYKLNDRLGICVGWQDGFDATDEDVIHSNDEPTWAIVAGIKVYTSDDMRTDYDWVNYPYFANGDTVDTSVSVSPNEDYDELANYFIGEFDDMKDWEIEEDGLVIKSDNGEEDADVEESLNEAKVSETTYFDGKDYNIFGKKIFVIGTTSETRDYNWEDIEVKDADPNVWKVIGFGRYKWLNRPWQEFTYAEALKKALVNAFGKEHEEEISDAIANSHRVDGALAILAGETNESLFPKHRKKVNESKGSYIDYEDIDETKYPNLKEALNWGAVSIIVYDDTVQFEKVETDTLEEADIAISNVKRELKELASEKGLKFINDADAYVKESKLVTEKKGKVEGEDDNVYQLVYDALFLGNKNFRPHIADEAGSVYDWEQSLIMLPGYNDYDLGIALEKEEDGKYAKAVADKLGLKYEVKPTNSLSDGYKFIATVRIPDDIANKDATEYVTSIGLDMNTIRPKRGKK